MKENEVLKECKCPTCGTVCKVGGKTTHYYIPVWKEYILAELEKGLSVVELREDCLYSFIHDLIKRIKDEM